MTLILKGGLRGEQVDHRALGYGMHVAVLHENKGVLTVVLMTQRMATLGLIGGVPSV